MARRAASARVHDRITAAIGVAALHALLGYALVTALGIELPPRAHGDLKLFGLAPERSPLPVEKPVPRPARSEEKRKGAPSPPNLKAEPTEILVPPPEIPLVVPPPVVAAPTVGLGSERWAGAAPVAGPGTGSGGEGTGGGGDGDGDGDYSPPHRLRGHLKDSDYPRAAGEAGVGRSITVQFTVETNGKVTECTVIESSGIAILDEATCRAIERRYRFEPSRDADGTAVPSTVVEEHVWQRGDREERIF